MNTTQRFMHGTADYSGERIKTLRIGEMVDRYPQPRYSTVCEQCGAKGTVSQRDLASGKARCMAAGCGKEKLREYLADTPRKMQERADARKRAALAAAEQTFKETVNQINRVIQERIAKLKDDEIYISSELRGAKMPSAEAAKFNRGQAAKFISECPEYVPYRSDETLQAIGDYFTRNGVAIADSRMIKAAFHRLKDYGLIQRNPVVEPDIEPEETPEPVSVEPSNPATPQTFEGWDTLTGRPRSYTPREVDLMTADEYRRAFRITREALSLPNIGPT